MDKLVQRYAKSPVTSAYSSRRYAQEDIASEEYGYALPLGRGIERCPVPNFKMPATVDPTSFLQLHTDDASDPSCRIKINHGTTTLAFKFQGGIVVAVDSRATAGSYIASGTVKKVIEINPYLLGTMAGGAADCQYWETYLGIQCRLHELRNHERISVAAASKYLANLVYSYKGMGLSMGTMICGWDKTVGLLCVFPLRTALTFSLASSPLDNATRIAFWCLQGPALFYVDSDGSRLKGDLFSVGSGSTFAYGVLDQGYHYNLSDQDAIDLGRRSIYAAGHRDAFSGNTINLYIVKEDGWKFIENVDVNECHYDRGMAAKHLQTQAGPVATAASGGVGARG
ncbi:Proteasome subunit beta type-5 [Rhodotorula toruloides]|uniref:FGENESH: predicted gene_1.669 protein n=1 Tax=Rhodotorula toruloides TaxID=5286 RepID=A0A0K3C7L3_RHOTO|nr:Proteasome subunit beta type-5 [Rhodotorula toruloides]